jgi:hypothetical protein
MPEHTRIIVARLYGLDGHQATPTEGALSAISIKHFSCIPFQDLSDAHVQDSDNYFSNHSNNIQPHPTASNSIQPHPTASNRIQHYPTPLLPSAIFAAP